MSTYYLLSRVLRTVYSICLLIALQNVQVQSYSIGYGNDTDFTAYLKNSKANVALFQSVLDKIAEENGGILYIKEGVYLLNKYIEIPSNVELKGDGIDKTILKLADKSPLFMYNNAKKSGFLRSRMTSNIYIHDLTLNGNKLKQNTDPDSVYGRYGVFTEGCKHIVLDKMKVVNFQGYGFDPHGWKTAPNGPIYGDNITITNCVAENNNWDGFTLDQSYNYRVENCIAKNNGRHGFNFCTGTQKSIALNNVASRNGWYYYAGGRGCGINIVNNQGFGTGNITLFNNSIDSSKTAGICLNDVFDIVVSNNKVVQGGNYNYNKPYSCMYFEKVRSSRVIGNICPKNSIMENKKSPTGVTFEKNVFVA